MYWLIEDINQLKVFYNMGYKEAFIEVIPFNDHTHPSQNSVSLLYIRPLLATKGFMLGVDHSETLNEISRHLTAILKHFDILYCRNKKEILHYFPIKHLYDITPPPHPYIRPTTSTHELFYRNHSSNPDINKIIPVVKHYEICEQMYRDLWFNISQSKTQYFNFFNNKVSLVFNAIERNGIHINKTEFEKYFYKIDSDFTYTQYNLKTTTTRPSNSFGGINYAALNKENGCRKSFIPRNDIFVELDISAYHPNLAARLIDYNFTADDIHAHFAALYKVDYAKAKEFTFKQLYGGVWETYKDIDFFKKIQVYIKEIWEQFENTGSIEVPISGYKIEKKNLEDMNPQKLFNYLLQGYETAQNILILWDILSILRNKNTKLVLYTYDSFLLDVDKSENIMDEVKQVFKKYKLNIKEKTGYDYDFERNY
jgi:hypothetical protein